MAIVGRAKYTHARARNFEKTRRERITSPRNFARARVCISPAPQSRSPKLEITRSLVIYASVILKRKKKQLNAHDSTIVPLMCYNREKRSEYAKVTICAAAKQLSFLLSKLHCERRQDRMVAELIFERFQKQVET